MTPPPEELAAKDAEIERLQGENSWLSAQQKVVGRKIAILNALLREARELLEPIESRGYGQTCGWYKRRDDFLTRVRGGEGG